MWLSVRSGGTELTGRSFDTGELLIGRDAGCDLVLDDERTSRRHARLTVLPGGWVRVEDLGSTNGTWVDGARLTGPVTVATGSDIRVGRHVLHLAVARQAPGASPPSAPQTWMPPPPGFVPPWPGPTPAVGPTPPFATPPFATPPFATPPVATPPFGPPPFGPAAATGPGGSIASGAPTGPEGRRSRRRAILAGVAVVVVAALVAVALVVDPFVAARTYSPSQLVAAWGPSTLYIQTNVAGTPIESGSGWVLNAREGLIVTNAHVVDSGPPTLAGLSSPLTTTYEVGQGIRQQPAALVGISPCEDLAVLKITHTVGLRSFVLGEQSEVTDGEPVTALGYPGGSARLPRLTLTDGVVSVTRTNFATPTLDTPAYPDVIQTNAQINPGNSGGPLLDNRGRIIGINTASITEENDRIIQGEGFAIGIDQAKVVLKRLVAGRSTGFAGFNFVFPQSVANFSALDVPYVSGGIIIPTADVGSPAYRAGFGRGKATVISAIDGKKLDGTLQSYCGVVAALSSGQSATFTTEAEGGGSSVVKVPFG